MKRLTFGFSKARNPYAVLSRAICWAQGTPFSHVYVKFAWPAASTNLIYQASKTHVNFEIEQSFHEHAVTVQEIEFDLDEEVWKRVATFIACNLNKPYSRLQIAGFALKLLAEKVGINCIKPVKNGMDEFICSELGAELYQLVKGVNLDAESMTPNDLYKIILMPGTGVENK